MNASGVVRSLPVGPVALAVGDRMPVSTAGPLNRTDFVRYAGAGGDFNPIHHDEKFAEEAGMPSVFGMGMLSAGILGSRLAAWVGPDSIRSFKVRFTGQVWPGDELKFEGRVTAVEADAKGATAELALTVETKVGQSVLRAVATAATVGP